MFVLSMNLSKLKNIAIVSILVIASVGAIVALSSSRKIEGNAQTPNVLQGKTDEERVAFLQGFGWEVSTEPSEIAEVAIPKDFGDVYENYNIIQKKQGYNLETYKGKKAKRYTYEIKNYEAKDGSVPQNVVANLLILDDKIIGGDICSTKLNGFMHGFNAES